MAKTTANKGETMTQETAVAEKAKTEVGQALDFAADAGAGMENVDAQSVAIPFIVVLQGLSPQCETVEGAKPGLLCNTVTNELFTELDIIPVSFRRSFLKWTPREKGGGYKGEMPVVEYEKLKAADKFTINEKGFEVYEGLETKDTRMHFVLVCVNGIWSPAVISMGSTQIKYSKRLMARIGNLAMKDAKGKLFNPPSFSHIYHVKTFKESNEKGTWYSFDINLKEQVSDGQVYAQAREFHRQVMAGNVQVAPPQDEPSAGAQESETF
jgi:hypothetical protein